MLEREDLLGPAGDAVAAVEPRAGMSGAVPRFDDLFGERAIVDRHHQR
jgi:hypothetical protein